MLLIAKKASPKLFTLYLREGIPEHYGLPIVPPKRYFPLNKAAAILNLRPSELFRRTLDHPTFHAIHFVPLNATYYHPQPILDYAAYNLRKAIAMEMIRTDALIRRLTRERKTPSLPHDKKKRGRKRTAD